MINDAHKPDSSCFILNKLTIHNNLTTKTYLNDCSLTIIAETPTSTQLKMRTCIKPNHIADDIFGARRLKNVRFRSLHPTQKSFQPPWSYDLVGVQRMIT